MLDFKHFHRKSHTWYLWWLWLYQHTSWSLHEVTFHTCPCFIQGLSIPRNMQMPWFLSRSRIFKSIAIISQYRVSLGGAVYVLQNNLFLSYKVMARHPVLLYCIDKWQAKQAFLQSDTTLSIKTTTSYHFKKQDRVLSTFWGSFEPFKLHLMNQVVLIS